MQKLREECGGFGVYARESREVAATTYYGLFALQHRGQVGVYLTKGRAKGF